MEDKNASQAKLKQVQDQLAEKDKQISYMYSFDRFDTAIDSKTLDAVFKKAKAAGGAAAKPGKK